MINQFSRTELLIKKEGIEKLKKAKVAVFGIGGVGSFVVEGLARCGIGSFMLVDNDTIDETNINRQIIATHKTVGRPKVEVAKERILEINPNANVEIYQEFFMPDSKEILDNTVSYIIISSFLYIIILLCSSCNTHPGAVFKKVQKIFVLWYNSSCFEVRFIVYSTK